MKNITTHIGTLEIIKRLPSSINGNPRYELSIGGIKCRTAPDSSFAYSVPNYEGATVLVTIGTYYSARTLDSIEKITTPKQGSIEK